MKTPIAAQKIGITEGNLHYLIRAGTIRRPPKDTSGEFCWEPEHIEAARQALQIDLRRKNKAVLA